MAVAARPGPSDARVPCPLCGGLIHPIAGKCKHCKADLSPYHAGRPAAKAALPPLAAPSPGGRPGLDGPRAVHAHALPRAAEAVLPPRPTGRSYAAEPASSGWRSWPVVVIILATIAIVVAIVLMAWPAGPSRAEPDAKRPGLPPPAPERMQTAPDLRVPAPTPPAPIRPPPPPAAGSDPWGKIDPPRPDPGAGALAPPDDDPDDLAGDPFAGGPTGRARLPLNASGMTMLAMADHMCRKIAQCSGAGGDPMVRTMCASLARKGSTPPSHCPAAQRCLEHIDTMPCGSQGIDLSQLPTLISTVQDCADAAQC